MKPSILLISLLMLALAMSIYFRMPPTLLFILWGLLVGTYAYLTIPARKSIILLPLILVTTAAFIVPIPLPDTWTTVQKFVTLIAGWSTILVIASALCLIYLSPVERDL